MDEDQSRIKRSSHLSNCLLLIALMMLSLNVKIAHASDCRNRLDIVIAVDTTSSATAANFENVKTEVKGIVSSFTIGEKHTRLALVSISRQAQVVVNFDRVSSLSDFKAAVDRLTFSTDTADLSAGIKVAKEAVLTTARTVKISKILILVKDKRSVFQTVPDTAVLTRVTAEAAGVKSLGAVIHAVGVGGVWQRSELAALYGTEYLMFKNKNKALESVKSLNNTICDADCPLKGTSSQKHGSCFNGSRHLISTNIDLAEPQRGWRACRTEIDREISPCNVTGQKRCDLRNRTVGACGPDGKVQVVNTWQSFDRKLQSCVTTTSTSSVLCAEKDICPEQVADVMFILDRSFSMGNQFPTLINATEQLISAMNIGSRNVRVGVVDYNGGAGVAIPLGSRNDKNDLIQEVQKIDKSAYGSTATDFALDKARETFATDGRAGVAKFAFVMTDGKSNYPDDTFTAIKLIKNAGVTLFAVGIVSANEKELKTMAEPEPDNMVILNDFNDLKPWAEKFSKKICIQLAAPHPKLCDDNVHVQSVSDCTGGRQLLTKTEYKYNAAKKCIKAIHTTEFQTCRPKCWDPIDGNEYFEGDKWKNLCHEFQCRSGLNLLVPLRSQCLAADGTCQSVGSPPFKCRDSNEVELENCQCIDKYGRAVLMHDAE